MLKVVVIGAGSSYTPELIEGFIKRESYLPVSDLVLVDIEEGKHKLDVIFDLAMRMITKADSKIKISKTLHYKEALPDANFVLTQIRVGQLDARILDERIPLSHGYLGQETNGAGGLFKGLRTIPVIIDIANSIHELCPDAWMINFTNPAGMLAEAMVRYTQHKKFVGVCNLPISMEREMAKLFAVEPKDVQIDYLGLNHFVYGFAVYIKGEDKTKESLTLFINANITMKNISNRDWSEEFIRALGVLPCSYHRYYYKKDVMLHDELENFKMGQTRGEVVSKLEKELFELYKDENLAEKPKLLEERGGAFYSDAACNLVDSIYNDKGDIQTVNTYNNGTIKDFDNDTAIETSCYITKNGPLPKKIVDHFPDEIKGSIFQIKQFEKLGAKAAVTGDYNTALVAMASNPLIANDIDAKIILDEMLVAHKKYLPQFSIR